MTRIEKEAIISGKNKSGKVKVTIDTGADISYINKEKAKEYDFEYTGKTMNLILADGREVQAEVAEGSIDFPKTCCKDKTKFAVVDDNSDSEILIGNDYIEKVGMKIDTTKKDEYNISCECGELIDIVKKISSKEINEILDDINE